MTQPGSGARARAVLAAIAGLTPGYFALVMATGIVSLGLAGLGGLRVLDGTQDDGIVGLRGASEVLLWIAVVSYLILVVLTIIRAVRFRGALVADAVHPSRAFGFFTFVAGTNVLGVRFAIEGQETVAFVLLIVGGLSWIAMGYVVPWTVLLRKANQPVLSGANGTWFIWVVGSQSVAVLAATLEPTVGAGRRELALIAVFSWSVGVCLYGAVATAVAARLMLYPFHPADLTPPYWVAMGATAITVVAGARIVLMADAPMVDATRGLVAGTSVVFWAFGTWLIPVLVAAGLWRHVVHRIPLKYEATLWSIVFPLGMYAVAGQLLGQADHLPIVTSIGRAETWVAAPVWLLTFVAMLVHLVRTLVLRPQPEQLVPVRQPQPVQPGS